MILLLTTLLYAVTPAFPDAEEPGLVEDIAEPSPSQPASRPAAAPAPAADEPIVDPEDDASTAAGTQWNEKVVRPKDISDPRIVQPSDEPGEIRGVTVHSAPVKAAPAVAATPAKKSGITIMGYRDFMWRDTKESVEKRFDDDRPLVSRGEGKWIIQDICDGEKASIAFRFTQTNNLNQVICQFKQGVENASPDHALYLRIRQASVARWGQPTLTNESPAPDSPSQAVEWSGTGKAVLMFDRENGALQLTVESAP